MISLINQEVDAIILNNLPMEPLADLIIQAREEGIGVYNNDSQLMEGCITNATMPNGVASMEMYYLIGNLMRWNANMVFNNLRGLQVHPERADPATALSGPGRAYPGMIVLDEQDVDLARGAHTQQVYDFTMVWLTRFGEEIDVIFCTWDGAAIGAAEAITTFGIEKDILVTGIDGGSRTWAYIRDPNSAFKYSYAQPFELYTHKLCTLIEQLQVKGLRPGHPDVELTAFGTLLFSTGIVVGPNNVPEVGKTIHAVFNYYGGDPDDPNAWWNWQEAGGPYMITDGTE
jgi:ABC-type sugar transport system substrate-binding protein